VNKNNLKRPHGWHNLFEWILYLIPCLIQKLAEAMTKLLKGNKNSIDFAKKWFIRSSFEFCYIFIAYYFTFCIFYYVHIEKLKGIEDFLYGDNFFFGRNMIPKLFDKKQVAGPEAEGKQEGGNPITIYPNPIENIKTSMSDSMNMLGTGMESGMNMLGTGMGTLTTSIFGYFTACMYVLPNIFSFSLTTVLPKLFTALKIQDSYACTFLLIFVIMYIIVYFLLDKFGQMFLNVFYWKPDKSLIIFIIIGWIISFGDLMKIPKGPEPMTQLKNNLKRLGILGPTLIVIGYLVHLAVSLGLSGVATLLFLFFFFSTCLGIFLPSDFYSKVTETVISNSIPKTIIDTAPDPVEWATNPLFDTPKDENTVSSIPDQNNFLKMLPNLSTESEPPEEQTEKQKQQPEPKQMNLNSFLRTIYPFFLKVIFCLFFFYKFLESMIFLSKPSTSARGRSEKKGLIGFWAPIMIINLIAFIICFLSYYYSKNTQTDTSPQVGVNSDNQTSIVDNLTSSQVGVNSNNQTKIGNLLKSVGNVDLTGIRNFGHNIKTMMNNSFVTQ
jgi:hypothetical protein